MKSSEYAEKRAKLVKGLGVTFKFNRMEWSGNLKEKTSIGWVIDNISPESDWKLVGSGKEVEVVDFAIKSTEAKKL